MNWTLQKQLLELCKFPIEQKWELIYKGSRDGFENSDFHAKCDGKLNTLTVIRTESGNIFGGFTKKEWKLRKSGILQEKVMQTLGHSFLA